jgi:hypothetical protein
LTTFKMKRNLLIVFVVMLTHVISRGQNLESAVQLDWYSTNTPSGNSFQFCRPCDISLKGNEAFIYFHQVLVKSINAEQSEINISEIIFEDYIGSEKIIKSLLENASTETKVVKETLIEKGTEYLAFRLPVILNINGKIKKITSFKYQITTNAHNNITNPTNRKVQRRGEWPSVSVLASGNWYKIGVRAEGVYRLDRAFLESLGINMGDVDPRTIKIFGNHGNILPELNSDERDKDLREISIQVMGEQDGKFDNTDFILFYGQSPDKYDIDTTNISFHFNKNYYAKESIYFITLDGSAGKRMQILPNNASQSAEVEFTTFDDIQRHERDLVNHIKSGRIWYGEHFDRVLNHSINFTVPNRVESEPVTLRTIMVGRSLVQSAFTLNINGQMRQLSIPPIFDLDYTNNHVASPQLNTFEFNNISGSTLSLNISYNKPLSTSEGWIDFIEVISKRNLIHTGDQTRFCNLSSTTFNSTIYQIAANQNTQFWDVTDPFSPKIQNTQFSSGTHRFFIQNNKQVKRYISFSGFLTPRAIGQTPNQNLHGVRDVDYVIVSPKSLISAANSLADFHRNFYNYKVYVADLDLIYNEFSSGIQDLTAIRDFIKMLWDEASSAANRPQNVLLFGDASYDYLDILNNNTNVVPTYQSINSHNPNTSFCSDDYFVLMDENEPRMNNAVIGLLDLGVGRITINNLSEANEVVEKIKRYHHENAFGNWRNNFTFVADDMDASYEGIFLFDSERFSETVSDKFSAATFNKIYLDAFEQQSLGGAQRYPDAVQEINNGIEKGTLLWTYNGHGGQFGLASERVIEIPQINSWQNTFRMPVFMTATCELSRYDDPGMQTAGERILLNPIGGGIGLLTTTRLVFVSTNSALGAHFFNNALFDESANFGNRTLGEIYRITKNRSGSNVGDRPFAYLGDPGIRLAIPQFKIVLDSLNGKPFTSNVDTLKALSRIQISGRVLDINNNIKQDFDGIAFPSVFDKPVKQFTRLNDLRDRMNDIPGLDFLPFNVQNNILFNGRASVKEGRFRFSFIVPKDINYRFDTSRISLYANNSSIDAAGNENRIVVGGSADSVGIDNIGPEIELFMNDFSFVNGGMTGKNPLFIATLFDENGINTAGSGIGREIVATIDKGAASERSIVLNEYYQANVDSYQAGEIRYRLGNITEGKHTITLKAWDVFNNSSEATLEFIVEDSKDLVIKNLLNYPNPFSTRTEFHFDHNKPGQDLTLHFQIMTIGGRVVKSHFVELLNAESHLMPFEWDGRDEFGDKLSKGVYIYRLRAKTKDGKWNDKYEKLVILN